MMREFGCEQLIRLVASPLGWRAIGAITGERRTSIRDYTALSAPGGGMCLRVAIEEEIHEQQRLRDEEAIGARSGVV